MQYPRIDFNIDMRQDNERKTAGSLIFNVWCVDGCEYYPEDIEPKIRELVNNTFYDNTCALWDRSESFSVGGVKKAEHNIGEPEISGVEIIFELLEFPEQISTTPDPIQGLILWTKKYFKDVWIIGEKSSDEIIFKPSDKKPAIYWRFASYETDMQNQIYAVTWYNADFYCHVIAESIAERNRWIKAIIEQLELYDKIKLLDGSPMLIKSVDVNHSADGIKTGQVNIKGYYGVLNRPRVEHTPYKLNHAIVEEDGKSYKINKKRKREVLSMAGKKVKSEPKKAENNSASEFAYDKEYFIKSARSYFKVNPEIISTALKNVYHKLTIADAKERLNFPVRFAGDSPGAEAIYN